MSRKCLSFLVSVMGFTISNPFGVEAADDVKVEFAYTLDRNSTMQWLENSKRHKPRLPLPQPTDEDKSRASTSPLGIVNNGLMRRYYLPSKWTSAATAGLGNRQGLVDYAFKVELFWIVSRLNRCAYCLGHQESKLTSAGLSEEAIASLDGDWSDVDAGTRAARRLAQWKTMKPHLPVPESILSDLATRFDSKQVGEILLAIANYNAMNRWTGPLNIPQEDHRTYLDRPNPKTTANRSKLVDSTKTENRIERDLPEINAWMADVEKALEAKTKATEQFLKSQGSAGEARFNSWQQALRESADDVSVPVLLRARIFWLCARLDDAADAGAMAYLALTEQGESDKILRNIAKGIEDASISEKDRVALKLARKITLNPGSVGDDDIAIVKSHWGDRATAQIIETACIASAVDRCDP